MSAKSCLELALIASVATAATPAGEAKDMETVVGAGSRRACRASGRRGTPASGWRRPWPPKPPPIRRRLAPLTEENL